MTHPEIDPRRVGLCGYSNGGWVAPLAASRVDGVAYVIVFSGSGVSPARQEQIRRCGVAREVLGATDEQVALLARFWEHVFPFYATGQWTAELEAVIDAVENDPGLQALPRHEGMPDGLQPVPPRRTREQWRGLGGGSPDMGFDPLPVFQRLNARLLFVWGARDSVLPVEESREAVAAALKDREDVSLLVAPDAGHQMFLIDDGITYAREIGDETQRLRRVPRRYAPGVWEAITDWALGSRRTEKESLRTGQVAASETGVS